MHVHLQISEPFVEKRGFDATAKSVDHISEPFVEKKEEN